MDASQIFREERNGGDMDFRKICFLKVYTAEDVVCEEQPFYKALLDEARRFKIAGATVIRGEEGYGTTLRGVDERVLPMFFSGSSNMPVLLEIVDSRENIENLFPFLEKHGEKHFLALVTESDVLFTKYLQDHAEKLRQEKEKSGK